MSLWSCLLFSWISMVCCTDFFFFKCREIDRVLAFSLLISYFLRGGFRTTISQLWPWALSCFNFKFSSCWPRREVLFHLHKQKSSTHSAEGSEEAHHQPPEEGVMGGTELYALVGYVFRRQVIKRFCKACEQLEL